MNLKITIAGACGSGKTALAVLIANALEEEGIQAHLAVSAIEGNEGMDEATNQRRLAAIKNRDGRIEIHAVTLGRNADPLA